MRAKSKYKRCPKCRELVTDVENCANCAARAENPLSVPRGEIITGRRGAPTLDMIEGNENWWGQ